MPMQISNAFLSLCFSAKHWDWQFSFVKRMPYQSVGLKFILIWIVLMTLLVIFGAANPFIHTLWNFRIRKREKDYQLQVYFWNPYSSQIQIERGRIWCDARLAWAAILRPYSYPHHFFALACSHRLLKKDSFLLLEYVEVYSTTVDRRVFRHFFISLVHLGLVYWKVSFGYWA